MRVLSRRSAEELALPPGIRIHTADLAAGVEPLRPFAEGADILYHCAGEINDPAAMRRIHVEGTRNLLEAAGTKIGRWVQLSSVGVYGPRSQGIVTEQTSLNPIGEYEATKIESEMISMNISNKRRIPCVVLRPSNVFGPGMSNRSLYKMAAMIDRGLFFFIGSRGASANYIHADNVVNALMLCGRAAPAPGKVYNLSDHLPMEKFVATIAEALGKPSPRARIPKFIARWPAELASRIGLRLPLTPSRIEALTSRVVYSCDLIIKELGYEHELSMEAGLRQFLNAAQMTS